LKNYISGKILLGLESFPGLPKNGAELLAIIEKPRTTVTQNFFELVNSLFFAMPSKIISVKQATVLLRVKRVKQNVLVTCSSSVMD